MNPELQPPLPPGALFVALVFLAALLGLGLHALLLRRFGAESIDRLNRRVEGTIFCILLGAMIGLSGLQVLLRNVLHSGWVWIDPLVRTMVLWLAFLGALAATARQRHLHIDAIHRALPPRVAERVLRGLYVFAAFVCALLANAAYVYLLAETENARSPFFGVPAWAAQSILLWGFLALTYRFLVQAIWPSPERGHA